MVETWNLNMGRYLYVVARAFVFSGVRFMVAGESFCWLAVHGARFVVAGESFCWLGFFINRW